MAQREPGTPVFKRGGSGRVSHLETAFVGRTAEMADLVAVIDDVVGGQGRAVSVGGEPGIGKTTLARRLAAYARERGLEVSWCRSARVSRRPRTGHGSSSSAPAFRIWPGSPWPHCS